MAVEAIARLSSLTRLSRWNRLEDGVWAVRARRNAGTRTQSAGWNRTSLRIPANEPEEATARLAGNLIKRELEQVDAEVRAHEATHLAALGAAAGGGASYSYVLGPDGERYAVGGSVPAAASPIPGDPEATIRKAKALIQAAYAVALPSSADIQVAAEAYRMEIEAQKELARDAENAAGELGVEPLDGRRSVRNAGSPRPRVGAAEETQEGEKGRPHEWFA